MPALIGVLMLVGIVVTNAIVLMDLINQYRAQGMGVQEAVIEGGRRRLRPILMTAIATIFALLPMALGLTGERRLHLAAAGRRGHRRPGQLDAADPGPGADALHDGRERARSGCGPGATAAGADRCPAPVRRSSTSSDEVGLPSECPKWPTVGRSLVVDAANVVGSVPDGWWRDRRAAATRLRDALVRGRPADGLPDLAGPVEVVLVVEGAARGVPGRAGVTVVVAPAGIGRRRDRRAGPRGDRHAMRAW